MGSPWKEGDIRLEVDKLKYRKCIFKHIVKQSSCVKCCFELNMIKGRLEKTDTTTWRMLKKSDREDKRREIEKNSFGSFNVEIN